MNGDFIGQAELEKTCDHSITRTVDGTYGEVICDKCGKLMKPSPQIRPAHYQGEKTQVWDFLLDHGLGFLEGNVVKYVARYRRKDGLADLRKARTYLDKLISEVENIPWTGPDSWVPK